MAQNHFALRDEVLYANGNKVATRFPVTQELFFDDIAIVILYAPPKTIYNENVLAYGSDGEVVWQLLASKYGGTDDNPYVNIERLEPGFILATDWNGIQYRVNIKDGSAVACGLKRF